MVISKYNSREIVAFINFFKNLGGDSYNLLGRWCHKGVPNCNESVIDKKINFALLDNNLCIKNRELEMFETYNGKKKLIKIRI